MKFNKKILGSIATIGAVASLAVFATGAFFSDIETSEDNTFVAGAIDLTVDSEAHYAGLVCTGGFWVNEGSTTRPDLLGRACGGTWELTDLGLENRFFDYFDLKPGDSGENTISLHVNNNDAYMCAIIDNMVDLDNSQTEPELEAGDDDSVLGELSSELRFFAWADDFDNGGDIRAGNNIWNHDETILFSNTEGPASDVLDGVVYPMYTPQTAPFPGGETRYIGLYWCYGDISTDGGVLSCDGVGGTNMTQTDSLTADISFYVEQARNNENFECPALGERVNRLRLENETPVEGGPWIVIEDGTYADLTWAGDGPTFDFSLTGQGLAASTAYSLIYYADPWQGNNPGAYIGGGTSDGSGNIAFSGTPDLGLDLPDPMDANYAVGAKIWLVLASDYNSGTTTTGPMTLWNPASYLFEGNVYIHYNDTNN